jgi:hypothetical protein
VIDPGHETLALIAGTSSWSTPAAGHHIRATVAPVAGRARVRKVGSDSTGSYERAGSFVIGARRVYRPRSALGPIQTQPPSTR